MTFTIFFRQCKSKLLGTKILSLKSRALASNLTVPTPCALDLEELRIFKTIYVEEYVVCNKPCALDFILDI